jgi:AraC-like DNA-binding protein
MGAASRIARRMSWWFHAAVPPKKHKPVLRGSSVNETPVTRMRRELFARAPGLEAMERLLEGADDVVFCIKNRRGQYLAANEAFLRRVRLPGREALLGRTAREVFPALLAAGYEQQDALVFSHGQEVRDRLEMITHRDGSAGWYLADKVPVRDGLGEVIALAGISRDLRAPTDSDPRFGHLARAVECMRRDFAEPLRIAVLAMDAGMSLSRFERLMRAILRMSPRQFLTRLRVEAAADLLRRGDRPLAAIALDCGFCDQPTFCRQFKDATGVQPGAYRKLAQAW